MDLSELLKSHQIHLRQEYLSLSEIGIEKMKENPDPHHSYPHIRNLFIGLSKFLKNEKSVNINQIDFEILIPAICWHDVWKGSMRQTTFVPTLIFRELNDGTGSEKVFKDFIKNSDLEFDIEKIKNIRYAINSHAPWSNLFPRYLRERFIELKTLEAKILSDIDHLDAWNSERIKVLKESYIKDGKLVDKKLLIVAKWWVFNRMVRESDEQFHFESNKKEFQKRKKSLLNEVFKMWNSLDQYIDVQDPNVVKLLKIDKEKIPAGVELRDYYGEYLDVKDG